MSKRDLPDAPVGLPCHKYIARNLKTEKDIVEFEKALVDGMSGFGYRDEDISAALLMMSTAISPKSPIYGKKFELLGEVDLGNLLMSLRYDTSIQSFNNCSKFYRKWDDKTTICDICQFSKKYKNRHVEVEKTLVQYCFYSEDHFDYVVAKGITPDHFFSMIDILDTFPSQKPCLFDLYKACYGALFYYDRIRKEYFCSSDHLFPKSLSSHLFKRLKRKKLPEEYLTSGWSTKFIGFLQGNVVSLHVCSKSEADQAIDALLNQDTAIYEKKVSSPKTCRSPILDGLLKNNASSTGKTLADTFVEDFFDSDSDFQKKNTASSISISDIANRNTDASKGKLSDVTDERTPAAEPATVLDNTVCNHETKEPLAETCVTGNDLKLDTTQIESSSVDMDHRGLYAGGISDSTSEEHNDFEDRREDIDFGSYDNFVNEFQSDEEHASSSDFFSGQDDRSFYEVSTVMCEEPIVEGVYDDNAIVVESRTINEYERYAYPKTDMEDLIYNPTVSAWELNGCLDIDGNNLLKLSLLEQAIYHMQRLYIEVAMCGSDAIPIIWMPDDGIFVRIDIKKERVKEVFLPILSSKKIRKVCFSPYKLYSFMYFHGAEIRNVYSIQSVYRLLYPSEIPGFGEVMNHYHIIPSGNRVFSASVSLSSPLFQFMPSYTSILHEQDIMVKKYSLKDDVKNAFLYDEALGMSYYCVFFPGKRFTLSYNKFIFLPLNEVKKDGYILSFSFHKSNTDLFFQTVLMLSEQGRFRKMMLRLVQFGEDSMIFFVEKQYLESVQAVINMALLQTKKKMHTYYVEMNTSVKSVDQNNTVIVAVDPTSDRERDEYQSLKDIVSNLM